jgi:hypothetical protein
MICYQMLLRIYEKKRNCFILVRRCKMRRECLIQVSSDLFASDPCPGTHKYLEVQYRCMAKTINQSYTYILGLFHYSIRKSTIRFTYFHKNR